MRVLSIAFVCLAFAGLSGCVARSSGGANQPQTSATPAAAPNAFIDIEGVVHLKHGVAVKQCVTGKPGTKLLNGYSVAFGRDDVIEGGEVLVPEYRGDGTYEESASKRQTTSRVLSWVILNVAQGPGFPHGTTLEERPDTTATITIGQGGKEGHLTFEHYHSLYGRNGDEHGGEVSGSIAWTCSNVIRIAHT